jgi:DNA-binding GntR family transcriptional regulator
MEKPLRTSPGPDSPGDGPGELPAEADTLEMVVSRLEEDIVLGRLHPRERLIEDELMERFKAKRHVVRNGLAALERMGIVERIPNRGALVRVYGAAEIEQLYVLRTLLETEAARLIPLPLPDADIADLRRVQAVHDEAVDAHDLGEVFHTNVQFHRMLFTKTGNPYLVGAINDFALRTHGIRFYCLSFPGYLAAARREHWEMIRAIETGDRETLVGLCRNHLLASRECYERAAGIRRAPQRMADEAAAPGSADES